MAEKKNPAHGCYVFGEPNGLSSWAKAQHATSILQLSRGSLPSSTKGSLRRIQRGAIFSLEVRGAKVGLGVGVIGVYDMHSK